MAEVSKGYSLNHAFQFYKDKYGTDIDKATYRKICYAFNKMMVEEALAGSMVDFPHSMGSLWIKKYEMDLDKPNIDLNESKKAGKIIYHLNEHSDGFNGRWSWSKRNNLVTNLIYYSFHATRENRRKCAAEFKKPNGHKKYFT